MEKLGFGPGRKELQETVETQRKQLLQYQSRFKDVVRAYKSLLKEKEALEASLTVLSVSQQDPHGAGGPPPSGPPQEDGCSLHSEDSLDTAASVEESEDQPGEPAAALQSDLDAGGSDSSRVGAEPLQQATPPPSLEAERRLAQLKNQLTTLTSALATVTQEKSRMEASFQADKRQLKQEVEEQEAELHTLQMHKDVELHALQLQQEAELHGLQLQLAESRARIITQQHERQQEQDDHALQLRELQRILQQERDMRQDAELRLQEGAESQSHLQQMRDDRDELSKKLQAAEDERRKPDPRAEQLQRELTQLKTRIQDQISAESRKACEAEQRSCEAEQRSCEAEQRSRDRAQAAEDRVSVLELRVSELSELLGSSEKQRQREQHAAQRLREEVLQLEAENKTLAIRTEGRTEGRSEGEEQLDVVALKEKLEKVKKLLQQRNPEQEVLPDQAAAHYQQELRALRDEFERYKLRAQLVLKNKNTKDGCQAKELEEVRDQLSELKEKYINLRIHSDEAEAVQRRMLEERQQLAAALQLQHRQEAEQAAALHREQLLRLEAELHKQRGRTMQLLKEKEQELEALRAAAPAPPQEPDSDALSVALRRAAPSEPTLLLYAEQLARKEAEAGALRREKHRLQDELHRLQAAALADAEQHGEEAAALRGRVDKLQRDQSREGANMEYLKNVTYKFLTLQDASGRMQTLNAILTILSFSPQEKSCVTKLQRSAWWR
ncbi:GRIP and coiled-coil domain containing protein 1 [Dissostichus eleginoides]|uniref:GRIP and coiled-coil domain containing protein 1 n=1 Tax=Dissostichus eleginoides TaxID=100907 RepID=A0AAD9B667_DISEL|nr:GRIP and coiled-coil domain containing protein 1 [Dissostichus eleginoides]